MRCCACCAKPQGNRQPAQTRKSLLGRAHAAAETELRLTELVERNDFGAAVHSRGWSNNLPVVIVPGFCSSGLKVVRSDENPEWANERIWFSLQKLSASKAAIGATKRRSTMSSVDAQLIVTVHRASNIPAMDSNGKSDPYVRVRLLSAEGEALEPGMAGARESGVQRGTLDPQWEEDIIFGGDCPLHRTAAIDVLVLDKDKVGADDICGGVVIPVDEGIHQMTRTRSQTQAMLARRSRRSSIGGPLGARNPSFADDTDPRVRLYDREEFALSDRSADAASDSSAADMSSESLGTIIISVLFLPREASSSEDSGDEDEDATLVQTLTKKTKAVAKEQAGNLREIGKTAGKTAETLALQATQHAEIMQDAQLKALDKSAWLRHILLAPDGESDPDGITVRNVDGIAGVDYLEDGHFVGRATTWVFAKVVEYLLKRGYQKDNNLRAAPYDWRVPPQILEQRDGYFSSLVKMIESTSARNGNKPVVLLGHSMGNKMAHYFLNWVVVYGRSGVPGSSLPGSNGKAWISRYIHSFFAVAAPFLGAGSACRGVVSGEDMGLSAFLTRGEVLTMSRNFGSAPWLLPTNQLAQPNPYHTLYFRNQCVVTINVDHFELAEPIEEAWMQVEYKKTHKGKTITKNVRTKLVTSHPNTGGYVLVFEQRFQFIASKPLGQPMDDAITFTLRGKSKGKAVKRAFQKKKLQSSSRTSTSAGLGSAQLSPVLGKVRLSLADLFGTPDEFSVLARRSATVRRRTPGPQPTQVICDTPSQEDDVGGFSATDVARICTVQACWRGHHLRKTQWMESQWKLHKGVKDARTAFWSNHHRIRAKDYGWVEQDSYLVESAADALQSEIPVRDNLKDLKTHAQSFAGCEAVEFLRKWLHENSHPHSHADATALGGRLLRGGFIKSCEDRHLWHFDAGYSLYSFTETESPSQNEDDDSDDDGEDSEDDEDAADDDIDVDDDNSSSGSDHDVSSDSAARNASQFVTGFSMATEDDTDDDDGGASPPPPPVPSSKLARAQERSREREQKSGLRSPPPLPSKLSPHRRRRRCSQQQTELHDAGHNDGENTHSGVTFAPRDNDGPSAPPIVQETHMLRPSSPGLALSILNVGDPRRASARTRFVSSANEYKFITTPTAAPKTEAEVEQLQSHPEPEPEPEPELEPEPEPDVELHDYGVVSVQMRTPDTIEDPQTGREVVSYKIGVFIDEEEVHTIEGRYSQLRRNYKAMPKLLLNCSVVFPGKHPEKGKTDASLVTLRQKELRHFFSALLLPSGYRRLPQPIRKLHRKMDIPDDVSARLIRAEFGKAVDVEQLDHDFDDLRDAGIEHPGGLPEGSCDEGTIDVLRKVPLQLKGDAHVGDLSLRCTFEFGNDELSYDLGSSRNVQKYEARDPKQILKRFGALNVVDKWESVYEPDPCLPGGTSYDPPPCQRVFHVYGTNLQTEIAYAYKRIHAVEVDIAGPKSCSISLDSSLDKAFRDNNYVCKGGIIFETKDTDQTPAQERVIAHDRTIASGDGTCPYASMRHSLSWDGKQGMRSEVVELPGQEHREILASPVFHQTMCDYLCETLVVYVVAARNLPVMDFSGSSDPWCEIQLHYSYTGTVATRRTKTHYRNLNPDFQEIFTFGVTENLESASFLSFEVFDADAGGARNEHIGVVEVPFSLINEESPVRAVQGWFQLSNRPGYGSSKASSSRPQSMLDESPPSESRGEILLHCELESSGQSYRGIGEKEAMRRVTQWQRNRDRMKLAAASP